jgi:co-chaperonin GroES (HSP10)
MTNLSVLKNNIIFQFLDKTEGKEGSFSERTRSGLIIPKLQTTQKGERWGKVVAVGPDVQGVVKGDYILIEPLMWTVNGTFEGEKFWKTNDDKVMIVSNELSDTVQY